MKKRLFIFMLLGACLMVLTGCQLLSNEDGSSDVATVPSYTGTITVPTDTAPTYVPQETTTLTEGTAVEYVKSALAAVSAYDPSDSEEVAEVEAQINAVLPTLTEAGLTDAKIKALCEYVVNNAPTIAATFANATAPTPTMINTIKQVYTDVVNIIGQDNMGKVFYAGLEYALSMFAVQGDTMPTVLALLLALPEAMGETACVNVANIMATSLTRAVNYVTATELVIVITILNQEEVSDADLAYVASYFKNLMVAVSLTQEEYNTIIDATLNNSGVKTYINTMLEEVMSEASAEQKTAVTTTVNNLLTTLSTTFKAAALPMQRLEIAVLDQFNAEYFATLRAQDADVPDITDFEEVGDVSITETKLALKPILAAYDTLSSADQTAILGVLDALTAFLESNVTTVASAMGIDTTQINTPEMSAYLAILLGTQTASVDAKGLIAGLKTFVNSEDGTAELKQLAINYAYTKLPKTLPIIVMIFSGIGGPSLAPSIN